MLFFLVLGEYLDESNPDAQINLSSKSGRSPDRRGLSDRVSSLYPLLYRGHAGSTALFPSQAQSPMVPAERSHQIRECRRRRDLNPRVLNRQNRCIHIHSPLPHRVDRRQADHHHPSTPLARHRRSVYPLSPSQGRSDPPTSERCHPPWTPFLFRFCLRWRVYLVAHQILTNSFLQVQNHERRPPRSLAALPLYCLILYFRLIPSCLRDPTDRRLFRPRPQSDDDPTPPSYESGEETGGNFISSAG